MKAIYIRTDNDQTETYLLCDSDGTTKSFYIADDTDFSDTDAIAEAEEVEGLAINDEMEAYCNQIAYGTIWQFIFEDSCSGAYRVEFTTPKPNDLPHDIILKEAVTNAH